MNWLRAKARYDRWDEDMGFLRDEMAWTLLFFDHEEAKWQRKAAISQMQGEQGHEAYALKQAAMWKKFGVEGRIAIDNVNK